jgi:hypothetical protein
MSLIPARSPFKKSSTLPHIVILVLFFLVASCSTKGPGSPLGSYPDRKYEDSKDPDLGYRQGRLPKQSAETEESPEQDSRLPSSPENLTGLTEFADDLDRASLEKAVTNQLEAMFEQEPTTPVRLGSFTLTRGHLVETLEAFLEILRQNLPLEEFNKRISEEFILYRVGKGKRKEMLFTGYYRPVIQASLPLPNLPTAGTEPATGEV